MATEIEQSTNGKPRLGRKPGSKNKSKVAIRYAGLRDNLIKFFTDNPDTDYTATQVHQVFSEPGMVLYDRHKYKAGNVRGMTKMGEWSVTVVSVNTENRTALVQWNGNAARQWSERNLTKLYATRKPKA